MKHINLIEWLQTDSHGKQSATRDHHGTKSRELPDNPRLYRYPCATLALPLRYVAMIFAVLVMSIANIGMAWGADETIQWTGSSLAGTSSTHITAGTATAVDGDTYAAGTISISSSKIVTESKKHTNDTYWEDFSAAAQQVEGGVSATGTARIELPFTVAAGYTFTISDVGYKMEQGGGGGPAVHAFIVQGSTTTWLNYTTANTIALTGKSIALSAGSAKLVFVLGVTGNFTNGRQFKFSNISIKGAVAEAGGVTSHSVSAVTSTGTNTYGTVSAAASSVAEGGTTTITAVPASGYRVTNWAVSGTGASISPTGASNSTTTTLTMGTANATVTVTFGAIPTHSITYTNLKGADNSANPTTYTEGVGVASFANLRHVVGYDFTGWSPSSISSSATTDQTIDAQWTARAAAAGTGTLTYALAFESSIITTSSITRNNGALYDATNISTANTSFVSGGEAPGNGCSGKLATTSSKSGSNYVELTFKIADGYTFTPSGVSIRANAVSNNKTLEVELKDNAASPHTKSVTATLAAGSTSGGVTYNLDFSSSPVTLEGTVTLKIYVYGSDGATKGWRIGPSVIVNGTVASATPSCTAPNHVDISGTNKYLGGQTISLTAAAYSSAGTGSPIADANITGWQWQKQINSVWTNVENGDGITGATTKNLQITSCTHQNSGQYRCVVSTGATCSTNSDDFGVHVFTVYGGYVGDTWSDSEIQFSAGTSGTATVHLNAGSLYKFHVRSNNGAYYCNGEADYNGDGNADGGSTDGWYTLGSFSNWSFGRSSRNFRIYTGAEGDYTITVDIANALVSGDYVTVSVTYPTPTHPSEGYAYFEKPNDWNGVKLYWYTDNNSRLTSWDGSPEITATTTICGTTYYYTPLGTTFSNVIFRDKGSNQWTSLATSGFSGKYLDKTTYDSPAWASFSTYTITYAANGGGGSMSATSGICPDADQAITSNAFTAPTGCASFAHWTANVNVKVGGNTITAGDPIANGATIQNINSNITLTAVWKLATPTIADNGDNTFSISGSMAGSSYYYTTNNSTPTTSSSLYSSAVDFSAGEANITAKAIAHKDGYVDSDVASQACTYHAAVTCTGDPTALVSGTLYQVSDMASACLGELTSTGQYFYGLSSNGKFYVNGTTNANNATTGTVEIKTASNTISGTNFTGIAWFKGAGSNTCRSIKFVVPSAGTLTIYGKTSSGNGNVVIKTESSGNTTVIANSVNAYASGSTTVSAGTYYVLSDGGSAAIVGLKFVESACTTPAAPTGFAAGSITSTGATFSITDGGDAASYDIYYSTSSSAPAASAAATTTSDSKTKAVTGLTANTTYYAWVRSVCDASHKSAWVALSGSSFTTTSTPSELTAIEANVLYQAADMANITFTGDDQWFAGFSTNAKFKVYGNGTSTSAFGKNENHNVTDDIDTKNFTSALYITAADNTSSSSDPTKGAIEFITPSTAGMLYLYLNTSSSGLSIKKKGTSTSTSLSGGAYKKIAVEANTHYFINGAGSNRGLYGIKFIADVTAPTFVSSVPANGATDVATSGTIVLTFSEALGNVDASKFTLTGATKGTVTIDGSDAAKVNITYSGAENSSTVTLATAAAAVSDVAGNALAAALGNISFTTAAAAPAGDCITIAYFETTSHNNSSSKPDNAGKYIYGYTNSAKTEAYAYTITSSTGDNKGQGTGESDYLRMNYGTTVTIYADNTTTGGTPASFSNVTSVSVDFKMMKSTYYTSFDIYVGGTKIANNVSLEGAAQSAFTTFTYDNLEQLSGTVRIVNKGSGSSNYHFYVDNIQICTSSLPSCTTPELPTLTAKTVCEGGDAAEAWDATITNSGSLVSGETVAYSWVKKGSSTVLSSVATYQPTDVTEAMAGTYVVTATVSADGKASKSASAEVDLTVTPATETPSITASKAKVYATDEVTLTATCGSTGVTWNWYLCANADGTGAGSSLGTSATYTIASAPAAGTYYYKAVATGDGTHSCGTAEYVYTLVVSTADACDKEFWFAKEGDRPTGAAAATHITGCPSGSSSASYTASIDGTNYTLTGSTGQKTGNVTIVVPADNTGTLYVVVQGSSSRTITLSKGGVQVGQETPANSTWGVFTFDNLDAGTYTLVSSGNISWAMMALKLCPTVACTDDTPTAAATNATVCAGGSITITATGYETGATFQWQKQNASTSVWENIDGATSDTYTVATAAAEHAGNYHIVANKTCARTSNTVTIAVPSAPVFNSFTTTRRVMETQALSISDVSATDAVSYTWYKSADATWDAGDEEIGDTRSLLKPYAGETAGSTYYVICRAANSCGTTTSSAITVNVQTLVEEDCAIVGNSGEHNTFAKTGSVSSGTYGSITELHTNSNNKYIYYTAESGYYFATATVNACVGNASDLPTAAYSYSTDGGANWTDQNLTGMTAAYADHVINLPANVNAFRVGRRLGDCGISSSTIYIHEVCFTYNESCTKTTVDPSSSTVSYTIGDSFTEPTFTVKSSGVALSPQPTITYTSSDETVATVDDDGSVNFQDKAGTVVITASYAGDATYCSSEGSYTITVSCSDEAPKVVAADGTNLGGCNSSITLEAKKTSDESAFTGGTYQWYRDGEPISGATSASYTAAQTGVYTVERTSVGGCVSPSSNKATITSTSAEPEVERLTPFQYYHLDSVYRETSIMRFRNLFAVKNAGTTLEGKHFKMELSRNGGAATDVTNSNAFVMNADTVLMDMNKLYGKYEEDDELVLTCSAVDCSHEVSSIYKNTITIYVINKNTPTLALICSGANGDGTRKTSDLVVGGDFLTGYNKADLCVQTGKTSFDKTQEWVLYTRLKENYIVTPVNGYAEFNKLNYEPFDILFLTDYPKASKSDAAATILDDMADLCDYRPLFTFKTHMVHKSPSKWAAKGFMAEPKVPEQSRLRLNIVCYAHPMFDDLKTTSTYIQKDASDHSQIVYTMLSGPGHESSKGMQGFPIDAAEGFVTIGLVHNDATAADNTPSAGYVTWTPGSKDVMLVAAAERQVNLEARMILFSINCGAQSKLTETGRQVVLKSLEYLLSDATIKPVADCSFTFTNGAGNSMSASEYASKCPACTGTIGDGKWSTAGNWGPDWILQPGKDTEVKIAAPVTVDMPHAKVRTVRILEGGSIDIPAGSGLEVGSTIRRLDGTEISPTEVVDLSIGSTIDGNGTLIFNNNAGDTKAGVAMYSKGFIDYTDPSKPKGIKNYQYIGVPFTAVNALYNYYGSWLYSWSDKGSGYGWQKVPNGGTVTAWTGYCITQETATTHWSTGTLAATNTVDIDVPAGENMVVGNSWTAPIYIKEFTDDDFENLLGNVYFFNTGVDKSGDAGTAETRYQNSTYVTVPIHSSPYTGDSLISSMQGFFVKSDGSAGALHLDYDRHVRPSTNRNILSGQMHAPVRRANAQSDEPTVLKIKVSGENYDDRLLLLEREDFTTGLDNGWDGDKWDGNESALYIYTKDSEGTENSVSAIPELEGTVIGFRAGEDEAYTLHFEYLNSEEPLYLYDVETNMYTQLMTGTTYRFFTTDNEKHDRFVITRKNPQVATGVGEVPSDQVQGTRARKLLIEDKMFIMVNGMLYDATGKVVK